MPDPLPGSFAASKKPPEDIRQVLLDAILDDSDEEFINRITEVLANDQMPPAALFLPLVEHEEDLVRRRSVFLLSQIGGEEAIGAISARLHDTSAVVRSSAVSSLGRLKASAAVAALCELFKNGGDPGICKAAAEALGKIGDPAAIPSLQDAAKTFPGVVVRSACDMAVRRLQSLQRAAAAASAAKPAS